MTLALTGCFVVYIVVLFAILLWRRWNELNFFKKLGIPGPSPHFLWGHYHKFRKNHIYWLEKWSKEYGDICGIFFGSIPLVVSTDVDLAQIIMVKDFSNFINRGPILELQKCDPNIHKMLSVQNGEDWKRQRSLITPAFTTKNMKEMLPLILKGADDFIACLKKQKSRFDIVPFVYSLSIDNIGRTVFGIEVGALSGTRSEIHKMINKITGSAFNGTFDLLVNSLGAFGRSFLGISLRLSKLGIIDQPANDLGYLIANVIRTKKQSQASNNLLQRLISASEPRGESALYRETRLNEEELVSNAVGSFFIGVDTTSIFLSYLFYCLGQHQEIQDRLRAEIEHNVGKELNYHEVSSLKYLDNVINEVLRLYPPATGFNSRVNAREFSYKGYTFPAGTNFLFVLSSIHRDERHWDDPLEFRPERFDTRSNAPLAFQPFGDGPRNCVGMRLALMSIKFIAARALQKLRFWSFGEVEREPVSVLSAPGKVMVKVEPLRP